MKKKVLLMAATLVFCAMTLGSQIVYAAKSVPDYSTYTLHNVSGVKSDQYTAYRMIPGHWKSHGDSGWYRESHTGAYSYYRIEYFWGE